MPALLPTAILPGIDLLAAAAPAPSQGIFIPLASLPGLTALEADEATGDGRKLVYEVVRAIFNNYNGIAAASRPTRFTVTQGTPAGIDASTVRNAYTLTFDLDIAGSDVAVEAQI